MAENYKRWYDKDPILKEALELLQLQTNDKKHDAAEFIIRLQEQVAKDVIERVYDLTLEYSKNGNRWYDNDPVMLKAMELLRASSPKTQRHAALKLLLAMENDDLNPEDLNEENKDK